MLTLPHFLIVCSSIIAVPIGFIAAAGVLLHLRVNQSLQTLHGSLYQRIRRFDPLGNVLFMGAVISLLLAMHWAGHSFAYSNYRIILLFTLAGVFAISFILLEYLQRNGPNAISELPPNPSSLRSQPTTTLLTPPSKVPISVLSHRSILLASLFALLLGGALFTNIYHLPLWFQVTQGVSPIRSAIRTLPLILSQLIATIAAGILTSKWGHYMPFVWGAAVLMPVGNGLLTTLTPGTGTAEWAGYLVLVGLGQGCGFQQGNVICQAVLDLKDVPVGTALVFSMQFLGGTIFLSAAQNRFGAQLRGNLVGLKIPGVRPEEAGNIGATELRKLVPEELLEVFLGRYNDAIVQAFQIALILSCLLAVPALGIEWRSVKAKK
jgi:hypothetical protein